MPNDDESFIDPCLCAQYRLQPSTCPAHHHPQLSPSEVDSSSGCVRCCSYSYCSWSNSDCYSVLAALHGCGSDCDSDCGSDDGTCPGCDCGFDCGNVGAMHLFASMAPLRSCLGALVTVTDAKAQPRLHRSHGRRRPGRGRRMAPSHLGHAHVLPPTALAEARHRHARMALGLAAREAAAAAGAVAEESRKRRPGCRRPGHRPCAPQPPLRAPSLRTPPPRSPSAEAPARRASRRCSEYATL